MAHTRTVEPGAVAHYKRVLAGSGGRRPMPVVVGTLVFDSWLRSPETRRTGKITMPLPGEPTEGGHAWCIVGYQDEASVPGGGYFIVRNSWGTGWGDRGFAYASNDYARDAFTEAYGAVV